MHYIPNFLTLLRILLIPIILVLFLHHNYTAAGLTFAFSVFTDFLDGYFARKYNLTSKLGRLMDPLADKLTVISVLYFFTIMEILPLFIAIVLLSRETLILIGSITSYFMGIDLVNPSSVGKFSIFILYIAITAQILKISYLDILLFYIVIPLNIYSAVDYINKFFDKSAQIN